MYDILEFLRDVLDCPNISDLRTKRYNKKAKLIFEHLDLNRFSLNQIQDAKEYIYTKIL